MYQITSRFLQQESFRTKPHLGIDFSMGPSTPLRSIQSGEIFKVVDYGNLNVGKAVFVKWHDGKIALYGHMSQISVKVGDKVDAGSLIGYSGNTGHVVGKNGGYHLHFAVKENGQFLDPSPYIEQIQNMNVPGFFAKASEITIPEIAERGYTISNLFSDSANMYQDFFQSIKLNLIHLVTSIDYTMFVQYIKYALQLFAG